MFPGSIDLKEMTDIFVMLFQVRGPSKQRKRLKINAKILSNTFTEKYTLTLGEFNKTTDTERVKHVLIYPFIGTKRLKFAKI